MIASSEQGWLSSSGANGARSAFATPFPGGSAPSSQVVDAAICHPGGLPGGVGGRRAACEDASFDNTEDQMSSVSDAIAVAAPSFTGRLLRPTDDDYDEQRKVHNGLIDRRPAAIAVCRGVADVVDAVR